MTGSFGPNFILLFFVASISSQNQNNPWALSVNSNIINLQGDNVESGFNFGGPALSLSRHIGAGISLGAQTSLGNVNNFNDSLKLLFLNASTACFSNDILP